ncbi:unnamed protein product [Caenorhabditis nigoni]
MLSGPSTCLSKESTENEQLVAECEAYIAEFFSGRGLISQRAPDEEQKKTHDEKYNKEVFYDDKDTAEGKPVYKKYREEHINQRSNCDAQYINNLHVYYGDGSKLKPLPKLGHYAVDFINPHNAETEATTQLKSLEVFRSKKAVAMWVKEHRKLGFMKADRQRSLSCTELDIDFVSVNPNARNKVDKFGTIRNLDEDYKTPTNIGGLPDYELYFNVSVTAKLMISRINAFDHKVGFLEIGKVLFSTERMCAYMIPKKYDTKIMLKEFSEFFKKWFDELPQERKATFGTDEDAMTKTKFQKRQNSPPAYFWRVNVILCLPEFESEGTMFRRARHVCHIPKSHPRRDIYFEIDTGMLRTVETCKDRVRRMPQEFARVPTPILEVRFEGAETDEDVRDRIAEVRKTGSIYIGRFECGNRAKEQNKYMGKQFGIKWCDLETAVALPVKKYPPPPLTTLFCGERDCMGLCCTDKYLEKTEILQVPTHVSMTWVADKHEAKKGFHYEKVSTASPKKKYYPSNPSPSYLKPANVSSFFQ